MKKSKKSSEIINFYELPEVQQYCNLTLTNGRQEVRACLIIGFGGRKRERNTAI